VKGYRIVSIVICLAFVVLLGACSLVALPLSGSDRDKVLAYSEAKTDSLMKAINSNDYAAFSRDLNDTMKGAITADGLVNMRTKVNDKIGNYVSRQVSSVLQAGDNVTVIYLAKFESDDAVTMRVSFETAEPHRIGGLWFDSAKLRQQ
jgi:hypothetical protein